MKQIIIILAGTFLLTQAARADDQAMGHIGATVCSFMDITDESGQPTGIKCVDCGDGCAQQIMYPPSMNAPPEQTITIVDTGDEPQPAGTQ